MTATLCLSVKNPKKISVVLRQDILQDLQNLADFENRSLSNLCAHLLEKAVKDQKPLS